MDLITELKTKANEDATFNAVCHLFALRERSRREVTASAIQASLLEEGFKASISDVQRVLNTLATLGVGKVQNDAKGRLRALKDIRITLQSIGKAAVGDYKGPMAKNKPAPQQKLTPKKLLPMFKQHQKPKTVSKDPKFSVTLQLGKRTVTLDIPVSLVQDDIATEAMK